jgi:hypothetical protein
MGGYKENSLVGTAPDASYYLFITEDVASENPVEESLWVEAAERADSLESILSIPLWGILNLIIKHITLTCMMKQNAVISHFCWKL